MEEVGRLTKAARAVKLFDRHARISLLKEAGDLRIGKSGMFRSHYSPKLADFDESLWQGCYGAGHVDVICKCS